MPTQPSTKALTGQVALITGATRGIGLALARALAANGCNLILTARDEKSLTRISRELTSARIKVLPHPCDIRNPHDVDALFRAARRHFKRLDILINNAGIAHANLPIEKLPLPVWKDVLDTNLTGTSPRQARCPRSYDEASASNSREQLLHRRHPQVTPPDPPPHNASKHGALGLTNTLREELRPRGIRVIALLPGATDTDIWTTLWPQAPRKKMMSPESVAEAALQAILQPANATVESLEILPTAGTL